MEAAGPKQRPRQYSVGKLLKRRGSAEFGSNLNPLSQAHCPPLLGPEHWQVGQALDAEPARKATLQCGFTQDGGDESERHRHPNRALTLVFAHGERLDGLGRVDKKSSSQRRASRNAPMKLSRAFVRMARRGPCASPTPWIISRRRREDAQVQGSVKTRSCPSTTIDSFRTISTRVALTVARSIAFRTSFSLGRYLRMGPDSFCVIAQSPRPSPRSMCQPSIASACLGFLE